MIRTRAKAHPRRRDRKPHPLPNTEGLDRFDRERAASLADEGGSTAAHLERMEPMERVVRANEEDEPLSKRRWIFVPFVLVLWALAAPAAAQIYLTPSVGSAFGGSTDSSRLSLGGDLAFLSHGLLGFSVDFGYVENFFGDAAAGGTSNVTTLMGDLVLASPGRSRFYASGGVGLLKTRVQDVPGFLDVHSSDFGMNVGAGFYLMGGGPIGLKGDVRYLRRLTDPKANGSFDVGLGSLAYWRATAGVAFRF